MNPIFKYNSNGKYFNKDLMDGYNGTDFSLLDMYLNDKG